MNYIVFCVRAKAQCPLLDVLLMHLFSLTAPKIKKINRILRRSESFFFFFNNCTCWFDIPINKNLAT